VKYRSRRFKSLLIVWHKKIFTLRNLGLLAALLVLFVLIGPLVVAMALQSSYSSRIATKIDLVKSTSVAIVLGAEATEGGLTEAAEERVAAAVELYKADKVQLLIMSGDDRAEFHNQPEKMIAYAVKLGVPATDMRTDVAARTYDSCYAGENELGLTEAILVSHPLHLARSLYLCNSLGLRATGYAADIDTIDYAEDWFYEIFSFVKAIWDINVSPPSQIM
jgi:SanA protein